MVKKLLEKKPSAIQRGTSKIDCVLLKSRGFCVTSRGKEKKTGRRLKELKDL